jgi:hypothetical protein
MYDEMVRATKILADSQCFYNVFAEKNPAYTRNAFENETMMNSVATRRFSVG